jgi:hypothetical protein
VDQHLIALAGELDDLRVSMARRDPAAFCEYVLRDEKTRQPITLCDEHRRWHQLCTDWDRLMLWAHYDSGKSTMISVGRVLWELGQNPNLLVAIMTATDDLAIKTVGLIAKYIVESEELHRVFPDLQRDVKGRWSGHKLDVVKPAAARDASVTAAAVGSNNLGSRWDLLILDDVVTRKNAQSQLQRDEVHSEIVATAGTRVGFGGRIWALGNVWHSDDAYHRLAANPRWASVKVPVLKDDGEPVDPKRWPKERVEAERVSLGPLLSKQLLDCKEVRDAESRFAQAWVAKMIERGASRTVVPAGAFAWNQPPPAGYLVVTGVDPASGKKPRPGGKIAETAIYTTLFHPGGDREPLECWAGHWDLDETMARLESTWRRTRGIIFVEGNGVQNMLAQAFARTRMALPIRTYTTAANRDQCIETMGAEMASGRWILASKGGSVGPDMERWLADLAEFQPGQHPGDRLMASMFAVEGWREITGEPAPGRARIVNLGGMQVR